MQGKVLIGPGMGGRFPHAADFAPADLIEVVVRDELGFARGQLVSNQKHRVRSIRPHDSREQSRRGSINLKNGRADGNGFHRWSGGFD